MTDEIESLLQDIGRHSLAIAGINPEKLLLYCEVEEGAMSTDLFYRTAGDPTVWHILGPDELDEVILRFWDVWKATPGNEEWRCMSYAIHNEKFTLGLDYPNQLDPDEDLPERRPRALMKAFGTSKVTRRS